MKGAQFAILGFNFHIAVFLDCNRNMVNYPGEQEILCLDLRALLKII